MKENKIGNPWRAFIKISIIFYWEITLKLPSHFFKKEEGGVRGGGVMEGRGWEVCPTILLKLPQNSVICIDKVDRNNFAQVHEKKKHSSQFEGSQMKKYYI